MAPSGITYYCSGSTPCKEITEINIYYTKDDFVTVQMQATQFLLNKASLLNCSSVRRRRKKHGLVEEFTDYDSVVVFSAVARAYIAKFFVTSH